MTCPDLMPAPDLTPSISTPVEGDSVPERKLDSSFANIDWQAPWLQHLNQLTTLSGTVQQHCDHASKRAPLCPPAGPPDVVADLLNTALNQQYASGQALRPATKPIQNTQAHTLQFVSQKALPEGMAYEHFIGTTGQIPTRDNLHDLFNGSIWLTFPNTKAVLNHYHMLEIAKQGVNEHRGRVRDTITVFDENGAILVTSDTSIGEALINFDWQASLVAPRDKWDHPARANPHAQASVYLFGHALLEQLVHPRKPLCAHSVVIYVPQAFFTLSVSERVSYVDNEVAQYMHNLLAQEDVTPRQLSPLPVLGVPHFWAQNADPQFYEDKAVFRHGRRQKTKPEGKREKK